MYIVVCIVLVSLWWQEKQVVLWLYCIVVDVVVWLFFGGRLSPPWEIPCG